MNRCEALPSPRQADDRARLTAELMVAIEKMHPDAQVALALHLLGLETGVDRTLDIYALVSDRGRAMVLDWESKFGPSHARKGGLL